MREDDRIARAFVFLFPQNDEVEPALMERRCDVAPSQTVADVFSQRLPKQNEACRDGEREDGCAEDRSDAFVCYWVAPSRASVASRALTTGIAVASATRGATGSMLYCARKSASSGPAAATPSRSARA
jgi:hypothetical protein